MTIKTIL